MKKILAVLLVLAALSFFSFQLFQSIPVNSNARIRASLHDIHILSAVTMQGGWCSAYAVGPHTIMSAAHCFRSDPTLQLTAILFENDFTPRLGMTIENDGHDHVLIRFPDKTFSIWVKLVFDKPKYQGERVFFWGNPSEVWGAENCYREGYYSGNIRWNHLGKLSTYNLFDLLGIHGDSGSLIFNLRGKVVGMVNQVRAGLTGTEEFNFTPAQIAHAGE